MVRVAFLPTWVILVYRDGTWGRMPLQKRVPRGEGAVVVCDTLVCLHVVLESIAGLSGSGSGLSGSNWRNLSAGLIDYLEKVYFYTIILEGMYHATGGCSA